MKPNSKNPISYDSLQVEEIAAKIQEIDAGITFDHNWGERALFYNPGKALAKGIYIATFKERDGKNDSASKLDRGGLYRFNLGLSKSSYFSLFGFPPSRPASGKTVHSLHDFTEIDVLSPHPVYGWMSWVAIINPSLASYAELEPLITESIEIARVKFAKRVK